MDEVVRRRRGAGEDSSATVDNFKEEKRDAELVARSSQGWSTYFIALAVTGVLLACILALLPSPIEPVAYSLPSPPPWTGPLEPNNILTQAERVFENQLKGPESIVRDGEDIYTGTADGRIISIYKGKITPLARLGKGKKCGSFDAEPTCGRPLGMRLGHDGDLLVADAYLGIFSINVVTGDVHHILSSQTPLAGQLPKFFNDVEQGPDETIYFTDSSTRWDRRHNRYCILEADMSGRLLSYDPNTMHINELAGGFAFANGLAISSDKSHILVAETTKARIMRYHLTGPQKGETDVFADNLPGWPDNIRRSGRGTYWVGMASIRRADQFSLLDFAAPYPLLRSLIAKLVSQETMMSLIPKHGLLVELNKDGQIVRTLHDPTGKQIPAVSEAEEKDGVLYLGSYYLPYLSRVYLNKK
ncbi:adipocyte plasma membrane-associated protein-like [Littorina saxatilis]|uniref:adipocyte plasma membrane-associated protein-like n=1 Tax=Littorina saxatilis TaxID=31220 RepID=UPI0038B45376